MRKVLGLDAKTSGLGPWFGFTSGGTLVLVGLMTFASVLAAYRSIHEREPHPPDTEEIEILKEEPPPPPPQPTAEAVKPAPETPPPPPPRAVPKEAPRPPPAPAQAAKVLTQEPDPNQPVDLTGDTIVQGNAASYAGGFTSANGTSTSAVGSMPAPGTAANRPAPPPIPAPRGPDRSRLAGPGNSDWSNCPFPEEADTAQIDDAYVVLQVTVSPDGSPAGAQVIRDPGNGFGREARRCAMHKHFQTALDHDGRSVTGVTQPFRVHFSR